MSRRHVFPSVSNKLPARARCRRALRAEDRGGTNAFRAGRRLLSTVSFSSHLRAFSMVFRPPVCTLLIVAAVLAGCAGQRNPFERNPAPTNYKSEILSFLRTYLNDPTNLRDGGVSQPIVQELGGHPRYVVCTRFNPRNSSGRYMGVVDVAFAFRDGRLDRNFELASEEEDQDRQVRLKLREVCKTASYQPFPELERLTR
jgi:hypothetical protein